MRKNIHMGADVPVEWESFLDIWRAEFGSAVSRTDAIRTILGHALGVKKPWEPFGQQQPTLAERDERAEAFLEKYYELGSYAAVAREVGISAGRVQQVIARYERRSRSAPR